MTGIDDIIRDAQNEAGEAHRWARINQVLYYLFGLLAIVAGLVAGLTAAAEWQKFITAAAGFLAAILAGFQTFLDTRKKADSYWEKERDLKDLIRRADQERTAGEPSGKVFDHLNKELTAITKRAD